MPRARRRSRGGAGRPEWCSRAGGRVRARRRRSSERGGGEGPRRPLQRRPWRPRGSAARRSDSRPRTSRTAQRRGDRRSCTAASLEECADAPRPCSASGTSCWPGGSSRQAALSVMSADELLAEREILDLHHALRLLVAALDDDAGAVAACRHISAAPSGRSRRDRARRGCRRREAS